LGALRQEEKVIEEKAEKPFCDRIKVSPAAPPFGAVSAPPCLCGTTSSQEFNEYLQAITEHNDMAKVASLQNG
jgi:hypothetical protein